MLIKNISKREGTGKLQCYKVEIYQVQTEKGGSKINTVHRNLLFLCNQLLSEKSSRKKVLYKRPQPPQTCVDSNSKSDSELVFICRRNIKDNMIDNNVEPEPEAGRVDSTTGDNTDSLEELVRKTDHRERESYTANQGKYRILTLHWNY